MLIAAVRIRVGLGILGLCAILAAGGVYAANCWEIDPIPCDVLYYTNFLSCEEQCGDATGFNQCDEGEDAVDIDVAICTEEGYYDTDFYLMMTFCSFKYQCKRSTIYQCNIPGERGDWECETASEDPFDFTLTNDEYVDYPGCGVPE